MLRHTVGTTVRLRATFYSLDGVLTDPTAITVTIYDARRNVLSTTTLNLVSSKESTGVYRYDYTIPASIRDRDGELYYEFAGTVGGVASVERAPLPVRWSR